MTLSIALQFAVVLGSIWMGARWKGVGLGLWGGAGLFVLAAVFRVTPTSPPIDVMLIILAVIMAASVMDAAGGIDYLVSIADRVIRANPKYVTIVAPITTWAFTFVAGTGHIVYPLLPIIYETAHRNGIRPERPMAVSAIASQQAITASPMAAATAAMIGLFSEKGLTQWGLPQILMICVPSTLMGVLAAAILSVFLGKDLARDTEYKARLASGKIPVHAIRKAVPTFSLSAKLSAIIFMAGVTLVVFFGFFPNLRRLSAGQPPIPMPLVIEVIMLAIAAVMMAFAKVRVEDVPKTETLRAGVVALVGIFGLAWLGDSFIAANQNVLVPAIQNITKEASWTFALGLFFASVLLYSQAATTRALMPLGIALGIPPPFLIGAFPAVNGFFFIPTYGTQIAAINFDLSGTTKIGKYVINHSFMIPGLVATGVAVLTGMLIAKAVFH